MDLTQRYKNCLLCPRECGIDRSQTPSKGYCGESDQLRAAYIGAHFGEEPPISGRNGSGTVFLSGCSLKCSFCQNQQISHQGLGTLISLEALFLKLKALARDQQVHNINFVTPDHFFPHIFEVVSLLRKAKSDLPMVFNTSGYQSVEMLKKAESYADIYLPDYKYSNEDLAKKMSRCRDYPGIALNAIAEMVRQKGFLDVCKTGGEISRSGVLVRHLILPGHVKNSISALDNLFLEFGSGLPLSIMSQYHPVRTHNDASFNRPVSVEEFNQVYSHAKDLGFEHLYVQFPEPPEDRPTDPSPFLPDFTKSEPFGENAGENGP